MCHNVARHSYCSTALLHLSHGIAQNRRFTVDLSGARPRRLKSEFLSIPMMVGLGVVSAGLIALEQLN